jgi:3'(2'), 5'-bisphosphate nucleotidase
MNAKKMLITALIAAIDAGEAILEVYGTDFSVTKKEDKSPLTLADQRSHKIILDSLGSFDIPILSEEGKEISYEERKKWRRLWVVDPLDGTKEFVKRNDEFTVNIALVEDQYPTIGVIYLPVKDVLYFAEKQLGAFRVDDARIIINGLKEELDKEVSVFRPTIIPKALPLPIKNLSHSIFTIVGSRSHATPELDDFVNKKQKQ